MYRRIFFIPVQLLYFMGAIIIIISGFYVQFSSGSELEALSVNFIISEDFISAPRGLILDSEGRILADNELVYDVYLKYSIEMEANYYALKESIDSKSLNTRINEIDFNLERDQKVLGNVNQEYIDNLANLSFLELEPKYIRNYRYPIEFAHILGYTGLVSEEDLGKGYGNNDEIGKYRVELLYEDSLKGVKGKRVSEGLSEILIPSKPGSNVHLTIDSSWQNNLYRILGDYAERQNAAGGAGVIMNVETGAIKAMVSYPGFDTNLIVNGISEEQFNIIESSRSQPLLDKAIGGAFTPGSIFKIFTAYSLLENEIIGPSSKFFSNQCMQLGAGYEFCEFGRNFYGEMNLKRALEKSSNLFFCNYSLELDKQKGITEFVETADMFGIGKLTGINFEGENSGNLDSPEYKKEVTGEEWFDGDTCNAVIGQGAILVSPIQVAVALATLNNEGKVLTPYVVEYINHKDNIEYVGRTDKDALELFKQEYANNISEGLSGVAYSNQSAVSGFLKDLPYNIKAKTGSAETYEIVNGVPVERVHSWIVGTFDYEGETYSFSFFHRYGGGGYYISPVLRDFLNTI